MGLGVLVEVPWDQTNRSHQMVVKLLGEDGQLYPLPGPEGEAPRGIEARTDFEVGRPPGIAAGTAQPFALALNLAQVPLAPGTAVRVAARDRRRDPGRLAGHLPDPGRTPGRGQRHQLVTST